MQASFRMQAGNEIHLDEEQASILESLHFLVERQTSMLAPAPARDGTKFDHHQPTDSSVLEAGHSARTQYGLGAGGSRWGGTYPPHLKVEKLISTIHSQSSAMTYSSTEAGMMSTTAALFRRIKGCSQHWLLVPERTSSAVEAGLKIAPRDSGTAVVRYRCMGDLVKRFAQLSAEHGRSGYATLYLDPRTPDGASYVDTAALARQLSPAREGIRGMTILVDDTTGLLHHRLGFASAGHIAVLSTELEARVLVFGSLYHGFGLNGAYLAGDKALIDEFRYTSQCYVFAGASPPYVMAMAAEELRRRMKKD